jgi:hypothetical protein
MKDHILEFSKALDHLKKESKQYLKKYTIKNTSLKLCIEILEELGNITVCVILFNNIVPLMFNVTGIGRNELMMKIGDHLFHN